MRIAVVGAAGATGRLVVERALEQGHEVVAVVRDPARVERRDPRLTVRTADATDEQALRAAFAGADAVILTIGRPSRGQARGPRFGAAARAAVAAMKAEGVGRVAAISAQGVGREDDGALALPLRVMRALLGKSIDDMREMEDVLAASGLDWTIMRPGGLTNAPRAAYLVEPGNALRGHGRTRRADLADALLRAVVDDEWPRRAMVVAY